LAKPVYLISAVPHPGSEKSSIRLRISGISLSSAKMRVYRGIEKLQGMMPRNRSRMFSESVREYIRQRNKTELEKRLNGLKKGTALRLRKISP
jgi:hypothetical protein